MASHGYNLRSRRSSTGAKFPESQNGSYDGPARNTRSSFSKASGVTLESMFDNLSLSSHRQPEPSSDINANSSRIRPEPSNSRTSVSSPGGSNQSPIWNLADRFDKDPSVGAMIEGQESVKQHYQTRSYSGKDPAPQTSTQRVTRSFLFSSRSINSWPPIPDEGKEFSQVVLEPFF